ncbi:MAG: DJ-1/PfpI family protein [Candidatus Hadarchaeales archaeon]
MKNWMKALLIIAPKDFRDEELFHTKEVLEKSGIVTKIASTKKGEAKGMLGGKATAELTIEEVKVEDYDAVIFVGGSGSSIYFSNKHALSIAKEAFSAGKVVGAICIAPVILANAGILKGRRATVWDGDFVKMLEAGGAKYTGKNVEVDGKIVTANGPHAAREFGKKIAELLR